MSMGEHHTERPETRPGRAQSEWEDSPFRSVFDQLPVAVFMLDPIGAPYYANRAALSLLVKGIDPSATPDTLAQTYAATVASTGEPYPAEKMPVVRALAGHRTTVDDMLIAHPTGDILLEVHGAPILDGQGHVAYAVAVFTDITARHRLELEQYRLAEMQRLLLESSGDAIYGIDLDGGCIFINPTAAAQLQYTPEELFGRNMHATVHHTRADGSPYPVEECRIYQAFRAGVPIHIDEDVMWRRDGTAMPVEYRSHPMMRKGVVLGAVVTFRDIGDRQRSDEAARSRQEAAEVLGATDALTGLGNRHRAGQLLSTLEAGDAVIMIDLDHFKDINDEGGHAGGDAVLAEFGAFLRSNLRGSDEAARWGGDEFVVVLPGAGQGARASAHRLVVGWRARSPRATVSAGVAVHGGGADDATLVRADRALYEAKRLGRDCLVRAVDPPGPPLP